MHYLSRSSADALAYVQTRGAYTVLRSATAIFRRCGNNIGRTLAAHFLFLALALSMMANAQAQSAANGALLYVSEGCTGCHQATPTLPQLNAANASSSTIFNYVIANNYGGALTGGTDYMGQYKSVAINGVNGLGGSGGTGLNASQRADIAAYLASVVPTPTVAVAYHGTTADIPLSLTHDGVSTTGGSIALYTSIAYSSLVGGTVATGASVAGTSGMGNAISQYTAAYTHTANNCNNGSFVATASGPGGSSSGRTVNITVTAPAAPNISTSTTTSTPAYNTGTAIPITSSGGPISSITVTSGLSNGGSLVTNGTTSFTYTSNAATYSPTDSFTYRANGPCANSGTVTVNISISAPPTPVINSTLTANGSTGVVFGGYTITASNLPTSYNATSLPPGLSINTSTGVISGTPTTAGTYNTSISATNSSGTDTETLVFTIALSAPAITSTLTANGSTGNAFTYSIVATNSPTSYNATGLPSGLSINTSTGVISGTPTADGVSNVSISATNATATDTETLVINISLTAPSITSSLTASGSTGVVFGGYTITATNTPTSFNATGLPPGLSVNTATGAISGTPTTNGTYNVSISATNATATDTQTLVFTIALSAPSITSTLTASGATSVAFAGYTITATNSPTSFGASSLPPGLSINTATGVISGTPTLNGTFNTTITATNATATDSKTLVFTITLTAPSITSANTANGTYGVAFSYQITASNMPTSYAASGLPTGVSVDTATGLISGTPTAGGTYNATVSATNATGTANLAVTMTIAFVAPTTGAVSATIPFNTATAINLTVGGQFTQVNIASAPANGTAPTPAPGATSVTYTPTTGYTGSDSFTYTATGPGGTSSAATVTITVSTQIPTAGSTTMAVNVNTATTLDLAPFITGSSISGISVATQGAHGTVTVSGTVATYTPVTNYFGTDTFTYLAYGNGGTSPTPGTVTVTVSGRPDPTQDATVTGVINSQIDTAKRFATAQIMNFNYRMEALHRRPQRNLDRPVIRRSDARPAATGSTDNAQNGTTQNAPKAEPAAALATTAAPAAPAAKPSAAAPNPSQPIVSVSSDPMGKDAPLPDLGSRPGAPTQNKPQPSAPNPALRMSSGGDIHSMGFSPQANAADRMMGNSVRFGVRDLAGQAQQAGQTNPLTMFATALSASNTGSASDPAAATNKALLTTLTALQSSTLNLASSTGAGDGATERQGFDYWIAGGVRFGTRGQSSTSGEQRFTTDGISMGMDKRLSDSWVIGGGVGMGRDNTVIGTDGSTNKSTGSNLAFYGSYQPTDSTFIDGLLGYGTLRYKSERFVAPISDYARADRTGNNIFTSLTAGYEFRSPGLHLSPYGRVDYAQNRLDEATETGAGAYALTYARQTADNLAYALGLRAETAHETDFGWALPRMRIEFQHDVKGEQQAVVSYADTPGTTYAIASTESNRNSILFGFGTDFLWRSGLKFSIDYQIQRSSMQDQNQAVLFKLTKQFGDAAPPPMLISTSAFALSAWKISGDAGYTYDSNINRASVRSDRVSDSSYNLGLNKNWRMQMSDNTRLTIGGTLGGEKFRHHTGLDRMSAGSKLEYQYRRDGSFGSPIWSLFGTATADAYATTIRDGYRYSAGVSVMKPLTDKINVFSAVAHNRRNGSSAVFDTKDNSAKLNLDYAVTETSTLYLNTEYRAGDIVSSGTHTLSNINISKVFTRDDVYTHLDYYAYRFDGKTALLAIGYNLPFGPKDSVDISWQRVRSEASKSTGVAGWPSPRYFDSQFSIVYLYSF